MSVVKRKSTREPILIISFELNKPTRPTMTIYEDSDIEQLIEEFVKTHQLKQTATIIIRNVIQKNIKEMKDEQSRRKAQEDTIPKPTTRKANKNLSSDSNKQNIRQPLLSSKSSLSSQSSELNRSIKKLEKQLEEMTQTSALCRVLEEAKNTSDCQLVGMNQLQQEFDRQFQTIKTNRMLRNCELQLRDLYTKLTRLNPPGLSTIQPDYIDFSCFEPKLLDCLENFFAKLQEQEFIDFDYDSFKYLLQKYRCQELVKILLEQPIDI